MTAYVPAQQLHVTNVKRQPSVHKSHDILSYIFIRTEPCIGVKKNGVFLYRDQFWNGEFNPLRHNF